MGFLIVSSPCRRGSASLRDHATITRVLSFRTWVNNLAARAGPSGFVVGACPLIGMSDADSGMCVRTAF